MRFINSGDGVDGMQMDVNKIYQGNTLEILKTFPDECVDCIMTSPPYYGLRDYGIEGQIGLEKTLDEYLDKMLQITAELKRILKKEGTMWWNHGDSYGGSGMGLSYAGHTKGPNSILTEKVLNSMPKVAHTRGRYEKCLLLQSHRLAIRMIDGQGWILRNTVIWHKPNIMPESVKDRFTDDFEYLFFFVKSKKYWFEQQFEDQKLSSLERLKTGWHGNEKRNYPHGSQNNLNKYFNKSQEEIDSIKGRNKRCVWTIPTKPYPESHFAVYPKELCVTPIKAGCPEGGIVLDPFLGSGTTALVTRELQRNFIGIELNSDYIKLAEKRLAQKFVWD